LHGDIVGQPAHLTGIHLEYFVINQFPGDRFRRPNFQCHQPAKTLFDIRIALQKIANAAVEIAMVANLFKHHVQINPGIFCLDRFFQRCLENIDQLGFEAIEQLADNLLLALEVVIKIARADVHFIGDIYR